MKISRLFVFITAMPLMLAAGGIRPVLTAPGAMSSATCLTVAGAGYAAFYNPALLPTVGHSSLSLDMYKPYNLPDLSNGTLRFLWHRSGSVSMAALFNQLGNNLYRESQISISGGMPMSKNASLGLRLNAWQFWVKGYGSTFSVSADVALMWHLPRGFTAGLLVANVVHRNMDELNTGQNMSAAFELGYTMPQRGHVAVQMYEDVYHRLYLRFGTVWRLMSGLSCAVGVRPGENRWSTGFMIQQSHLRFSYSLTVHDILGETHAIGVSWIWR